MLYRWLAVMVLLAAFAWPKGLDSLAETPALPEDHSWIAFFNPPQGARKPVHSPIEQYREADWPHLKFREYLGARVRLVVLAEEKLPNHLQDFISEDGLAGRLVSALRSTQRFDVVTFGREALAEIEAGIRPPASGQYLIRVTPMTSAQGDEVRMTFRIIDAMGGQVIFASTESAKVSPGVEESTFVEALDVCINKGTYRLTRWLANRPWAGSVVEVEPGRVVIDAGRRHGLEPKMQLRALVHQEVIDPESGQLLGATRRGSGVLELVAVQEQRAVARVVEGCENLATGDRVELMQ